MPRQIVRSPVWPLAGVLTVSVAIPSSVVRFRLAFAMTLLFDRLSFLYVVGQENTDAVVCEVELVEFPDDALPPPLPPSPPPHAASKTAVPIRPTRANLFFIFTPQLLNMPK
ncbi:hypothetical protein F7R21_00125 [Burkholderia latens]|uniref:Uncharacterized protein n=1 Tax=Burkholderia latens TaxID=488446 RepID=A0A6H9T1P8_9BURK|nr:hypothetical protein F7R21_00125 [Burkholderia latens]